MDFSFDNFEIDNIEIHTSEDKIYFVYDIVSEINLYESVFNNTMSGDILVADANDIISNFPILGNGQEVITMTFSSKFLTSYIKFTGTISEVSQQIYPNEKTKFFKLTFDSFLMSENNKLLLDNYFEDETSNIVGDIIEYAYLDALIPKELKVVETNSSQLWNVPSLRPLQFINSLCVESVSINDEWGYVFYEDNTNLNFVPIEWLYKQESKITLSLNSLLGFDFNGREKEFDLGSIQDVSYHARRNVKDKVLDGSLTNKTNVIDLEHRKIGYDNFDYQTEYNLVDDVNEHAVENDFEVAPVTFNNDYDTFNNVQSFQRNQSRLKQINNIAVDIRILGNSSLKAGDMCTFNIPSIESANKDISYERFTSGKYMMASIRHTIVGKKYFQQISLMKPYYNRTVI